MNKEGKEWPVAISPARIDKEKVKQWARQLDLQVNGALATWDVEREVSYDPTRLSEERQMHSALVAYWANVYAKLENLLQRQALECRRLRGELATWYRRSLPAKGMKVTEATIQEALDSNERLINAESERLDIQMRFKQVKGILEALRARKEMLLQEAEVRLRNYYSE
jgi:hypothetical protein